MLVYNAKCRGGDLVEHISLNACHDIKFRISGPCSVVGNNDAARNCLRRCCDLVEKRKGMIAGGVIKGIRVENIAECLALDKNNIHGQRLGGRSSLSRPACCQRGILSLRHLNLIQLVVMQEAIQETRFIKYRGII